MRKKVDSPESIVMLVFIHRILNAGQLLYSLLLHWHVTCSVGMLQIHIIELCLILQMMYGSAFWFPHNSENITRELAESTWPIISMTMFCKPVLLDCDVGEQSGPGLLVM